ncbi:MAG: UvrB/UvrC motif-containing protein [Gemmatimonadales bacterium]|nr:UvrB/UvrC motif-containing protein [Gemmatimonadales bacterium]
MSCDQCREREAVIHLTQIVNEQVTTLHLCERCAAEKGVESPGGVAKTPLGTFLAAMGKGYPEQTAIPARGGDSCQRCGGSLQDFRESGRLGCPECYRSFEAPLRDLLRRLHGSTHHMGERYVEAGQPHAENGSQAADLKEQLRLAVETENFELAAELRDRLRVAE